MTKPAEEHLLEFATDAALWRWDMERIRAKGFTDNVVVSIHHPLMLTLDAIRKTETIVHEIILDPMALADVNELLADTLHCELAVPGRWQSSYKRRPEATLSSPFSF